MFFFPSLLPFLRFITFFFSPIADLELYAPSPSPSCLPLIFLLTVSPFLLSFSIPSWLNIFYVSHIFLTPISHSLLFWYTLETNQSPPLTLFSSPAMLTRGFTICFPSLFPILYLLYLPSHTPTALPSLLNLLNFLPTTHPLSTKGSIFVPLLTLPFYLPLQTASHSPASLTLFPNRSYSGKISQVTPSLFTNYDPTAEGFLSLLASLFHYLFSHCVALYWSRTTSSKTPILLKTAHNSHSLHQLLSKNRWLPLFSSRFSILFSPFALPYALRKPYLI